nr:Uncharacterised protein [Streptococcus thermophilus]
MRRNHRVPVSVSRDRGRFQRVARAAPAHVPRNIAAQEIKITPSNPTKIFSNPIEPIPDLSSKWRYRNNAGEPNPKQAPAAMADAAEIQRLVPGTECPATLLVRIHMASGTPMTRNVRGVDSKWRGSISPMPHTMKNPATHKRTPIARPSSTCFWMFFTPPCRHAAIARMGSRGTASTTWLSARAAAASEKPFTLAQYTGSDLSARCPCWPRQ